MIGYITIGVSNLDKSRAFYTPLFAELGIQPLLSTDRLQFYGHDMSGGMIGLCLPHDGQPNHPGNGNMTAIPCDTTEQVDAMYNMAMELGATCEGEPGKRMPVFYGAYFRDLDGNKMCFFKMDLSAAG